MAESGPPKTKSLKEAYWRGGHCPTPGHLGAQARELGRRQVGLGRWGGAWTAFPSPWSQPLRTEARRTTERFAEGWRESCI